MSTICQNEAVCVGNGSPIPVWEATASAVLPPPLHGVQAGGSDWHFRSFQGTWVLLLLLILKNKMVQKDL